VRGEMLLGIGDDARLPEAEAAFECALHLARQGKCRLLELRAAVSYLRLRRRLGDATGGRAVLAKVLSAFSEGLDTPLVSDARKLLGQ
jgi:hypothetical protein